MLKVESSRFPHHDKVSYDPSSGRISRIIFLEYRHPIDDTLNDCSEWDSHSLPNSTWSQIAQRSSPFLRHFAAWLCHRINRSLPIRVIGLKNSELILQLLLKYAGVFVPSHEDESGVNTRIPGEVLSNGRVDSLMARIAIWPQCLVLLNFQQDFIHSTLCSKLPRDAWYNGLPIS